MLKKIISGVLIAFLSVNSISVLANEKTQSDESKYDIAIGSVEDEVFTKKKFNLNNKTITYQLDFSLLDLKEKNSMLNVEINYDKINKVSAAKGFNDTKKSKMLDNARNTKDLLENDLNSASVHQDLINIIESHLKQTGQNPIITLVEDMIENKEPSLYVSGKPEADSVNRIYTSASGTVSSIWGQTDVSYPKVPVTNYLSAASLTWNAPWNISNSYKFGYNGSKNPGAVRVNGSTKGLAYKFKPNGLKNLAIGARLLDGTKGGHNLFSEIIRTSASYNYSFSLSGGGPGLSVSPTSNTNSVTSHVYFTV